MKTESNLPPGVNVSDIPGNRPEDIELESAESGLMESLAEKGVSPQEYELIGSIGIPAIDAHRKLLSAVTKQEAAENQATVSVIGVIVDIHHKADGTHSLEINCGEIGKTDLSVDEDHIQRFYIGDKITLNVNKE